VAPTENLQNAARGFVQRQGLPRVAADGRRLDEGNLPGREERQGGFHGQADNEWIAIEVMLRRPMLYALRVATRRPAC
jgi:hypothetical protein